MYCCATETAGHVVVMGDPCSMLLALALASTVAYIVREHRLKGGRKPEGRQMRGAERTPVLPASVERRRRGMEQQGQEEEEI